MRIVILGAGGHGLAVLDAVEAQRELEVVGFLDDRLSSAGEVYGYPALGSVEAGLEDLSPSELGFVVAIGDNATRSRMFERALGRGFTPLAVIHPRAYVSPKTVIGSGSVVLAGAAVGPGCTVGRNVIINSGAIVEHGAVVGDHVHLAPGSIVGAEARVAPNTVVPAGVVVSPRGEVS